MAVTASFRRVIASQPTKDRSGFMMLGRNGDILNAAMICYHEHLKTKRRVPLVVGKEFRHLLDGFSYIEPLVFNGPQDQLGAARLIFPQACVLQSWRNPDTKRLTISYQKEAWRRAGKLDDFGTVPLVVDRRDIARESRFCQMWEKHSEGRPFIVVANESPSSPFPHRIKLLHAIRGTFPGYHTIDICMHTAHRFYDILGLLDRADLLITIDTAHLHLSRASICPVIAILNDMGSSLTPGSWAASLPPPQTVASFLYSDWCGGHAEATESVVAAAKVTLDHPHAKVIMAVDCYETDQRKAAAQRNWSGLFDQIVRPDHYASTSKDMGDVRELPHWKHLLNFALDRCSYDEDIIFWCNDDNALSPSLPDFLREHLALYGACSFRRMEKGSKGAHIGRDAFAFTRAWLLRHWDEFPNFYLGAAVHDLWLAAMIRLQRGIVTTQANLSTDFFPCDINGFVYHEPHQSSWVKYSDSPANRHNRRLFREWSKNRLPRLRFNKNDELIS